MIRDFAQSVYSFYKKIVSEIINIQLVLIRFLPRGRHILSEIGDRLAGDTTHVAGNGIEIKFSTPNWLTYQRATNLLTDEPETIAWIESFEEGSIFWDIGANIGSYSVYAAVKKGCKVIAFEPSFLNLVVLQKNIEMNKITDKVSIFPIGLSNSIGIKTLYFSKENFRVGGAHNSLGLPRDQYGNPMPNNYRTLVPAETMDNFYSRYSYGVPDYIKIDVDGLELEVLMGAKEVLNFVKEVSIEVMDKNHSNDRIHKVLTDAGLTRAPLKNPSERNVIYSRVHQN